MPHRRCGPSSKSSSSVSRLASSSSSSRWLSDSLSWMRSTCARSTLIAVLLGTSLLRSSLSNAFFQSTRRLREAKTRTASASGSVSVCSGHASLNFFNPTTRLSALPIFKQHTEKVYCTSVRHDVDLQEKRSEPKRGKRRKKKKRRTHHVVEQRCLGCQTLHHPGLDEVSRLCVREVQSQGVA